MELSWSAVGVILTLVSLIVTASTIYLKLFVSSQLSSMENKVMHIVKLEFQSKEIVEIKFTDVYTRIRNIEENLKQYNKRNT